MLAQWIDYMLHGSSEMTMPASWLENQARLRAYTAYTMRQLQQGSVVKDVAATSREAFWRRIAERGHDAPEKVTNLRRVR